MNANRGLGFIVLILGVVVPTWRQDTKAKELLAGGAPKVSEVALQLVQTVLLRNEHGPMTASLGRSLKT